MIEFLNKNPGIGILVAVIGTIIIPIVIKLINKKGDKNTMNDIINNGTVNMVGGNINALTGNNNVMKINDEKNVINNDLSSVLIPYLKEIISKNRNCGPKSLDIQRNYIVSQDTIRLSSIMYNYTIVYNENTDKFSCSLSDISPTIESHILNFLTDILKK